MMADNTNQDPYPDLRGHPLQVVERWAASVASRQIDEALDFYTPEAFVHLEGVTLAGRRHIRARLEALARTFAPTLPRVRADGDRIVARWESDTPRGPATEVRCRVVGGSITEQWIRPAGTAPRTLAVGTEYGDVTLTATSEGEVASSDADYALERVASVLGRIREPVLLGRIRLTMEPDPARDRPAVAKATLVLNGTPIRAHVAAHKMHEAADMLEERLMDTVEHRSQRLEWRRRHGPAVSHPGEWRHDSLTSEHLHRPAVFDRPADERQLVRHKTFMASEETLEEALFDMQQLDYDFYLFRDLDGGQDSLLERSDDGGYRLRRLHPQGASEPGVAGVTLHTTPAPRLSLDEAIEALNTGDLPFVFFESASSGRGDVLYRRYDGHYGLITPR